MTVVTDRKQRTWILIAMSAALAVVFLDQTSISVALPHIQVDLKISTLMRQWILNAYMLAIAIIIIFGGKLGDLFGRRKVLFVAMSIFALSSLSCALSQSGGWMITSRVLQGFGAGLIIPTISATLIDVFPIEERGKAMGLFVGIASIFLSVGPFLGGILTQYANWKWIFWINLPITFFSLILTHKLLPKDLLPVQKIKIDWQGFIVQALALCALIVGLMQTAKEGWLAPNTITLLLLAVLGGFIFYLIERKRSFALVDCNLFRNSLFSRCVLLIFSMQMLFASMVFWAIYLQMAEHYSPATAGMMVLPATLPVIFMAPLSGNLRDKYGPRWPVTFGVVITLMGAFWIGYVADKSSYMLLFLGFFAFGLGVPSVISNTVTTALSEVNVHQRGMASGVLSAARQLGSAVGLAVIGSIIAQNFYTKLKPFFVEDSALFYNFSLATIETLLIGDKKIIDGVFKLTSVEASHFYQLIESAYIEAFSIAMYSMGCIGIVGLLLALSLPRHAHSH